jgi:signal transduction histidine kinase
VDLLLSLVDDILDSAKMEKGAFRLNETEFALTPLLDEVRGIFEIQASGKGLEFEVGYEFIDSDMEDESVIIKQD